MAFKPIEEPKNVTTYVTLDNATVRRIGAMQQEPRRPQFLIRQMVDYCLAEEGFQLQAAPVTDTVNLSVSLQNDVDAKLRALIGDAKIAKSEAILQMIAHCLPEEAKE